MLISRASFANWRQRPVTWVLWATKFETGIVITPEEAEDLIPIVRGNNMRQTHILTYTPPLHRKQLDFNKLSYYAIPQLPVTWSAPSWLQIELGIFGGRLYFEFDEYEPICRYVGLVHLAHNQEQSSPNQSYNVPFTHKSAVFIQEWLTVRRKGQEFTHTPMGYMCNGKPLEPNHPFFTASGRKTAAVSQQSVQSMEEPVFEEEEELSDNEDDSFYDGE